VQGSRRCTVAMKDRTRRRLRRTSLWLVRYSTCFHSSPASSSCMHTAFSISIGSPACTPVFQSHATSAAQDRCCTSLLHTYVPVSCKFQVFTRATLLNARHVFVDVRWSYHMTQTSICLGGGSKTADEGRGGLLTEGLGHLCWC